MVRLALLSGALATLTACQAHLPSPEGGWLTAPPTSRRIVLAPVDLAVIARGDDAAGRLPETVTLGRTGDGPRAVLVRFDVPPDLDLLAAYLRVDRAPGDDEGAGVGLHVERIIDPWSGTSATWNTSPELSRSGSPSVTLGPNVPSTLRLDARFLLHDAGGHGVALVADHSTARGVRIALTPDLHAPLAGDPADDSRAGSAQGAPRLELYVK